MFSLQLMASCQLCLQQPTAVAVGLPLSHLQTQTVENSTMSLNWYMSDGWAKNLKANVVRKASNRGGIMVPTSRPPRFGFSCVT